jgi:lysine 6-dehydrogenase
MKALVFGSGLMGPAAAYNLMCDPDVDKVVVADLNPKQLEACAKKLGGAAGANKLATLVHDLSDEAATVKLMQGFDTVLGALPHAASIMMIRAAVKAGVPVLDLSRLADQEVAMLRAEIADLGSGEREALVMLGCGLEPGLTEIVTRYLAEKLDRVDEVHIFCGGIPEKPQPPLGYKIVFGGKNMPLQENDALVAQDGQLRPVPRYSDAEPVFFEGVGQCEAWHEGFMPWLMELPQLKGLKSGTQKTVRWPGYAAKVTLLKELGLLSMKPVKVDGVEVAPKKLLDAVLYPRVKLEEGEKDITLFRVVVAGEKAGQPRSYRVDMIDRYDAALGFTSMARTTAFTGAIIAKMMGRGEIKARGVVMPEKVIAGALFDRLVTELAAAGVRFTISEEKTETLG